MQTLTKTSLAAAALVILLTTSSQALLLVAIGASATTSCTAGHAEGKGEATGPAPSASSSAQVDGETSHAHEHDSGPSYAYDFTASTGTGPTSSASASAKSGLGLLDSADSSCSFTVVEDLIALLEDVTASASLDFGCTADTNVPFEAVFAGSLQVDSAGSAWFVGTLTDLAGTSAVTLPVGSGLVFTAATADVGAVEGLVDTGIPVIASFLPTSAGQSCGVLVG